MKPESLSAIADSITAGCSVAAVVMAFAAWKTAVAAGKTAVDAWNIASSTFTRDHRPLIRVVAAWDEWENPPGVFNKKVSMDQVILKNLGRGPGFRALFYSPKTRQVFQDVEAVEPIGDGPSEEERIGRVEVLFYGEQLAMNDSYHLYCQDMISRWHRTVFRPVPDKIECSFEMIDDADVPEVVRILSTVARP